MTKFLVGLGFVAISLLASGCFLGSQKAQKDAQPDTLVQRTKTGSDEARRALYLFRIAQNGQSPNRPDIFCAYEATVSSAKKLAPYDLIRMALVESPPLGNGNATWKAVNIAEGSELRRHFGFTADQLESSLMDAKANTAALALGVAAGRVVGHLRRWHEKTVLTVAGSDSASTAATPGAGEAKSTGKGDEDTVFFDTTTLDLCRVFHGLRQAKQSSRSELAAWSQMDRRAMETPVDKEGIDALIKVIAMIPQTPDLKDHGLCPGRRELLATFDNLECAQ